MKKRLGNYIVECYTVPAYRSGWLSSSITVYDDALSLLGQFTLEWDSFGTVEITSITGDPEVTFAAHLGKQHFSQQMKAHAKAVQ